jgi:hypothetical protein
MKEVHGMKILILKSFRERGPDRDYTVSMNTRFVDRFIGHMKGECTACGDGCTGCRNDAELDFSDSIAGVIEFPSVLPVIIDEPEHYVPDRVPEHDVLISVAVNEEILFSFLKRHPVCRAVIVPIEESGWMSPYGVRSVRELAAELNIESAFPKPFCSFDPSEGVLREFGRLFRIGKPELDITIENDRIVNTRVLRSAPCGATYFTARGLAGRSLDDDLVLTVDGLLSSYPCTADSQLDREFQDSIMHRAVKLQRNVLRSIERHLPEHALER